MGTTQARAGDGGAPPPLCDHAVASPGSLRYAEFEPVPPADRVTPPWPLDPPEGYLGQLADGFQEEQAALRRGVGPGDCHWYHEVPLPDGRRIKGGWDLAGGEDHYLGGCSVAGRRVLEIGPASGYLTLTLEQRGAEVVAFEAGLDRCIDLIPDGRPDVDHMRSNAMRFVAQVNNSWWWLKRAWALDARIVYGSVYEMPADIGPFDVAVVGALLLHLRDPYTALEQIAGCTRSEIVVTDVVAREGDPWNDAFSRFNPAEGDPTSWWLHTPAVVRRMLSTLGFECVQQTRHLQYVRPGHDVTRPLEPVEFFTVVARRRDAGPAPGGGADR